MSTLTWLKTLEKSNREQFQSSDKTLNDKISHGIKSGKYWEQAMDMEKSEHLNSSNVSGTNNPPLQDVTGQPLMIGADVIGLYPNLDPVGVANITAQAVRETKYHLKQ